jgi:hypothetical protein
MLCHYVSGHEVLTEVLLIVADPQGILDQLLMPRPLLLLNPIFIFINNTKLLIS